jgi:hypothetical protein
MRAASGRGLVVRAHRQRAALCLGAGLRDQACGGGEHVRIDVAAQRTRAELGGEPVLCDHLERARRDIEQHAALREAAALGEPADRDVGDLRDLRRGEGMEHHDLIEAVDQLGAKRREHGIAIAPLLARALVLGGREAELAARAARTEVRGQHDDRVVEERGAPACVGQARFAEDLQE